MSIFGRAKLYLLRNKGKSGILLVLLVVISTRVFLLEMRRMLHWLSSESVWVGIFWSKTIYKTAVLSM